MYRYDIHKIRYAKGIDDNVGKFPDSAFMTREEIDAEVKGKFKEIIDIIYSEPSSLCSKIDDYSSENSSSAVRSFVQNVLTLDVPAFAASPDADTAFDTLLPRSMWSRDGLSRYSSYIKDLVTDKYKTKSSKDEKS